MQRPKEQARPTRVYFFTTCVVDLMAPGAGVDAVLLLEQAGLEVLLPEGQTCCGQPAFSSGYTAEARAVAQAQLGLFPEPLPIVVPSGSCAAMMRHDWPPLFADDAALQQQARAVGERVIEFSAFLQSIGGVAAVPRTVAAAAAAGRTGHAGSTPGSTAQPVRVGLHTSCAARRGLGTHVPSEQLLRALPGVEVVTYERQVECCGFGGTFAARHPAVSGAMVGDKLDSVAAAGVDVLVSADCGCLLNLHHAGEQRRQQGAAPAVRLTDDPYVPPPRCLHLASFIRERLGADDAAQRVTD